MNKSLIYGLLFGTLLTLQHDGISIRKHATRTAGITDLIRKAEMDEPEEFLVYLPDKNVWVNTTLESKNNKAVIDVALTDSLLRTNDRAELWHFHNDTDITISKERPLYWIVPSISDLNQLFYFKEINSQIKGGIANEYGSLTFWTDTNMKGYSGQSIGDLLYDEAVYLQFSFGDSKNLEETARNYRGIVWTEWVDR